MPVFSCFTGFGFLEFSGEPSECEKVYHALVAGYRNPKTGEQTIDTSPGTHQEAKIYGWANAIAAARVTLRRAANELRAETSYELLESHEEKFGMTPGPNDTVADRRAALAAKQKLTRGPRHEAIAEALTTIFGDFLVAYRPISTSEATAWPADPGAWNSPGLFRRPDAIAKSIRLLTAVTRTNGPINPTASYPEGNITAGTSLSESGATTAAGQAFMGDGNVLSTAVLPLKKLGSPTGKAYAKLYKASGTWGNYVPTGEALATSEAFDPTVLTTSYVLYDLTFYGANQVRLEAGTAYVLALDYSSGDSGVNEVIWGYDGTFPTGNASSNASGMWASVVRDQCFYVYSGFAMKVRYENWNRSQVENRIVKGDVLVVDGGNWGVAERIVVLDAEGDGAERTFTAAFRKPHTANVHATTGPMPLWSNTKRHVLVVVEAAASLDVDLVQKTNGLFARVMRAPTSWATVQETAPGAGTVGPLAIGTTMGSPSGCATLQQVTL